MKKQRLLTSVFALCAPLCLLAGDSNGNWPRAKSAPCEVTKESQKDLVATAAAAGNFMTLLQAVKAAGLVEPLQGPGPYTVFAPTDAAFKKLDRATLRSLLQPQNREMLQKILAYHVIPGNLLAEDVTQLNGAKTLGGNLLRFAQNGNRVHVGNARLVKADITASNGTIHVIDQVLMPE